ncbi:type VI secretion system Vgr family protein [Paracoccus tegillarcae]|uniref:Type VI secretion system tip protein VgrG n=1 Tax=Paracoccus tegillarcae TaxID=1529068 RepID=A0A2K9EF65_9RHOB|nr:type VI secretion system tip protein TssI/VgrG [Paracoccus tegillarcae]AUH33593.1 type VI secretion system tip protein VgrG [Paracoccus tegillarcae]
MNAPFKQAERLGRLTTELGPDVLVLLRFDGSDHLNDLFEYRVEALATRDDLDFDALVGTHATVEIEAHDQMRPFDGIVTSARWAGVGENGHRYDLTLRPWFWLAGRRRNQRIFHNKTVVQIIQELLSDYASLGDPALEISLSKDYPTLEYTVQYRESDLDFARRQMERHGISFHFRHAMGSHTLVLTDDVLAHEAIGPRPFKRYDGHHQYEQEHFWDWAPERNIATGAVRLVDYNFKKPTQSMEVDRLGDAQHAQGQIESFDYPGDYLAQDVGRLVVGLRTEQERGADRRNRAVGDCVSLGAGMRMVLSGDKVPGHGESFLCLSASHHFVSEAYGSGGQGSDGYSFTGSYTLMPDTAPMAPPKRTPLAIVQGPQTATVVGEGEIDCDEYGRILVRFHWDLANAYSMRCRVSQNWAGAGWGGMVIPRIGMEVLVEFLEGDPDKPVVVGNVFNGKNDAPYPLPAHKTKAVWRSKTHKGEGFNELSFEDEVGQENIALHAQKDQTLKVLNNRMKRVDNDQIESVGSNKSIEIGSNHQERIGGSMNLTVGGGKMGLFAALAGIAGQATKDALNVAEEAGDPSIPAFLGGVVAATVGGEMASSPLISAFDGAGQNRAVAGAQQVGTGTALGSVLSAIMPVSGVMNTLVEKFQADTIGLARTEQIGLFKNTMVGAVRNTMVGQKEFTKVGVEQRLQVGKTKTVDVGEEYTTHTGQRASHSSGKLYQISSEEKFEGSSKVWEIKADDTLLLSAPGGYVEINKSGVRIRGLKVLIEGNAIDFKSGGPGEGSKCLRAMAKSATPFVR